VNGDCADAEKDFEQREVHDFCSLSISDDVRMARCARLPDL
jgi:hypothetical protein